MVGSEGGFIAVGFDGTAESVAALTWALRRADETRTAVKVVHCWPPVSNGGTGRRTPRTRRRETVRATQRALSQARRRVSASPKVTLVFSSTPTPLLLTRQSRGAALLVLGASSAAVVTDPSSGPVAGPCLKRVGCPVVVIDRSGRAVWAEPRYPTLGLSG